MAIHHDSVGLAQFKAIAEDWPRLKQLLAQRDTDNLRRTRPTVAPMAMISQKRATWELAVAAAAYSLLRRPPIVEARAGTDLSVVVEALSSIGGREKLPGFFEMSSEVVTLPTSLLIREAPRLGSMLHDAFPLTAASVSCTAFCMSQHPGDPDGFLRCMLEC